MADKAPATDEPLDLISLSQLMKVLEDEPEPVDDQDATLGTAPLPKITRMPEGMTVIEQQIGHAIGQWVFVMLCDCGRRWFSLQAQEQAQCPRCNRWVHIEASPREPG